jgi:hypothetical protein
LKSPSELTLGREKRILYNLEKTGWQAEEILPEKVSKGGNHVWWRKN